MMNFNPSQGSNNVTIILSFTEICALFRNAIVCECGGLLEYGQIPPEIDTVDITRMFVNCVLEPLRMRDPVVYRHMCLSAVTRLTNDLRNYTIIPSNVQLDDLAVRLSTVMERIIIGQISTAIPDIDNEGVRVLYFNVIRDGLYIELSIGL